MSLSSPSSELEVGTVVPCTSDVLDAMPRAVHIPTPVQLDPLGDVDIQIETREASVCLQVSRIIGGYVELTETFSGPDVPRSLKPKSFLVDRTIVEQALESTSH